ncbi:retinol dehydrogenase 7-like isoform X1 [Ambystoma mexicanum]|uniref:retinol dehydrogenase 7-like isoform X1 n=1 Tax=Ambystoma mexicanum TaxID=8296 RepID=UPI0037E8C07A
MWLYLPALLGLYFLFRWYRERQVIPNLTDKYVLITGCDSGFGNQLARQLDQHGLRVLATCFTQKGQEQLKQVTSQRLQSVILDVSNGESVTAMAHWVKSQVGDRGLWGLVNNAGIGFPMGPNEWLTKDDFMKVINVNLMGLIDVTLKLLPLVRKAQGRIVNVSSIAGRISICGGGYSIAKYGVQAFSDSLRRELSSFGVKVAIVEPGSFRTSIASPEIMKQCLQSQWDSLPTEVKESYGQQYFDKVLHGIAVLIQKGNRDLTLVTDCMEHGLTAVYPRTRYSAGRDAKLFFIPVSYMPTVLGDYLMK